MKKYAVWVALAALFVALVTLPAWVHDTWIHPDHRWLSASSWGRCFTNPAENYGRMWVVLTLLYCVPHLLRLRQERAAAIRYAADFEVRRQLLHEELMLTRQNLLWEKAARRRIESRLDGAEQKLQALVSTRASQHLPS